MTVVARLYPAFTAKYGTVTGLDPGNADLVRELFDRYAGGGESDRSLAIWLNGVGTRTAKGNPFSKDTVREMLVNSAYAGFVGARRDKRFEITKICIRRSSISPCSSGCRRYVRSELGR